MKHTKQKIGMARRILAFVMIACMVTTSFSPIVSAKAEESTSKPIFLSEDLTKLTPSNTEPDKTASKMVSSWQWNDPEGYISEGVLELPGVSKENPVNLDALVSMLPTSILATLDASQPSNTSMPPVEMPPVEMPPVEMPPEDSKNSTPVSISLAWSSKDFVQAEDGSFPVQGEYTFTATMEEGYTLSANAPSIEITVCLGGAMLLPSTGVSSNGIFTKLEIREGTATGTKVVDLLDANSIAGNWALKPGADYYLYADLTAPAGAEHIKIHYGGTDAPNGVTFANPPGGEYVPHKFDTHDYLDELVSYKDLTDPTYGSKNQAYSLQDGEMIYHIKKKTDTSTNTVFAIGLVVKDAMYDGSGSIQDAFSVAVGNYAAGSFTSAADSTKAFDLKIAEKGKFNSFLSPQTLDAAIGEKGVNGAMQYLANILPDQPEILYDEVSFDLTYPTGAELEIGLDQGFSKIHANLGTMTVGDAVPSADGKTQTVHVIVQNGLKASGNHGACFVRLNFPENADFKVGEKYWLTTANVRLTMGTTTKDVAIKSGWDKLCYTLSLGGQDETWMSGYHRIAYNHTMDVPPQSYLVPLGNAMIGNASTTLSTPYDKTFEAKYNATNTAANVSYITIPIGLNKSPTIEWSGIAADGVPKNGTISDPSSYQNRGKTFYLLPAEKLEIVSFTGAKVDIGALPAEYRSAAGATSWLFERDNLSGAYGYFTTEEPGIQVVNNYRLYNTDPALRDKPKGDLSATATGTSTDYCGIGWQGNPKLNGKDLTITDPSASINAGDIANLSGTLFPYTAPNAAWGTAGKTYRGTATLIMDPIIYLTLPQGMSVVEKDLSFTIDERSFYDSTPTKKTISHQIENVSYLNTTGDGVSIYKITFPKGTRLGYFDEKGIQSNLNYTIPLLTSKSLETRRYSLSELLCVTAQNRPEATKYDGKNAGAINYALADKYGINGGKPLGTVSREKDNAEGTKVEFPIGFGVQQSSEINLYSAVSVTKIGGEAIPTAEQRWYAHSSDPNSIALLGQNSEGRLRLQVRNTSDTPGTDLRIILPIPQKGADLGDSFMDAPSGFTMSMTYDANASDKNFTATYIKTTGTYDTITDKENIVTYEECTQAEANAVLLTANTAVGKGEYYIYLDFVVADGTPKSVDIWRPVYAYTVTSDRRVSNGSYVASEVAASSISGVAFADMNRNGRQDTGEGGAADVTVVARDAQNRIVSTKTDNNGAYQFLAIRESVIDMSFALSTEGQKTLRFNVPPLPDTANGIASTVTPAADGLTASKTFAANAGEEKVHAAVDGFVSLSYDGGVGFTGNLPKTGTHVKGTSVTVAVKPDNLAVKGKRFTGWNTAEDGTGIAYQPGASIQMAQSVTLYAQWELASYAVTFNYRGATSGNDEPSRVLTHGDTYGTLPTPTKVGYTFGGWYTDTTNPKTKVIDTTKFALGADTMLYALWTPKTMTVTYTVNGGSGGITPKTVSWEAGVLPTDDEAKTITKNGYTLSGWTYNGTAVTKLDTYGNLAKEDATTSIELVAQWKAKTGYTVKYDLDGGTVDSGTTTIPGKTNVSWTQNGLLPAKNPVKDNFSFKGWLCGSEAAIGSTTYGSLAKNDSIMGITLTAQWEAKTDNTVSYDTAGGSTIPDKTGVKSDAINLLPTETTKKPGYQLTGWKAGDTVVDATTAYSTLSTKDTLTITAQWAEKDYIIQYTPGNGSTINNATKKWADKGLPPTPTPIFKGYTFGGWYYDGTMVTTNTLVSALIPQDDKDTITLTAKWNERTYTVNYNSDGGTTFPQKNNVKYTSAGLLPDVPPVKLGYSFDGWKCGEKLATASTICSTLLTSDTDSGITFVAQWKAKTGFTVQYDTDGGTPSPSSKTVAWNDTNLLPSETIIKNGYTLTDWKSGRTRVTDATAFSALTQSDQSGTSVTLVAQWAEKSNYIVKYDSDGGTAVAPKTGVKWKDNNLLPKTPPTKVGYDFVKWQHGNADVDVTTAYNTLAGGDYTKTEITLKAVWTEKSNYIVKYDTGGGTVIPDLTGVKAADKNLLPSVDPQRDGYQFTGWKCGTTPVTNDTAYNTLTTENVLTLTAQWTAEPDKAPDISGTVEDENKSPVENASVKLTQGSGIKSGPVTTDAQGQYLLPNLKPGIYNLVAEKNGQIVTVIITVADKDLQQTLTLPKEKKNSVLEVIGSETPRIVVGDLEEVANGEDLNGKTSLTIKLTVQKEEEQTSGKSEHSAIRQSAGANADILFLDAVLTKQVDADPKEDIGSTNKKVLELVIPFDFTDKENVRVYRHHGDVDAFQKLDTKPVARAAQDETYYLDVSAGLIHVYAQKFSAYAIAFDKPGGGGGSNPGGGGGGGTGGGSSGNVPDVTVPPTHKPWTPVNTGVASILQTKEHIKYINGYVDLTVGPGRNMTRAEAAQMFYNLLLDKTPSAQVTFSDVNVGAWHAKAVNTLTAMGVFKGYENGTFGADKFITREEFCSIAMRFTRVTGVESVANFSDVTTDMWAYDSIMQVSALGWVNGFENGAFLPKNNITRSEVVTIVNNMLGRKADVVFVNAHKDIVKFTDLQNTGVWYYYDMVEASMEHKYVRGVDGVESWTNT